MKKIMKITLSLMLLSLLFSCTKSKAKIYFNNEFLSKNKVLIDDNTLTSKGKSKFDFTTMDLGTHRVAINGENPMNFYVSGDGILNIAQQEFVIFPINFSMGEKDNNLFSGIPTPIVVDSFVVVNKNFPFFKDQPDSYFRERARDATDYNPSNESHTELVKIPKKIVFIDKSWDYDIYESIPQSIQTQQDKNIKQATVFKKSILDALGFLHYAAKSGEYKVIHR